MCPKITTHLNYSLNITVLRIKVGLNDQLKCVYHGLSIIGEKLVFTFCDNKPKRNIYRSIYSGKSQRWIILFWYKECSTINATPSTQRSLQSVLSSNTFRLQYNNHN